MGEVVLKITGDNSDVIKALGQVIAETGNASDETKKLSQEYKKSFKDAADASVSLNKQLSDSAPTVNIQKQSSAINELKKQIKDFESAALKAGEGTAAFAKNIALAGEKKAQIKDLKDAINGLDPDRVAQAFLNLGKSVAGGFTIATSAMGLLGAKNAEIEKSILKVQAAQGLLAGLQQLSNSKDELGKVKIIALEKLRQLEIKRGIVLTEGATVVQRIFNLVASGGAGAVGLLAVAITAVIGVIAAYVSETRTATEAEKDRSRAADGTIIKNKELRDSYNQYLIALREVQNEQRVLNGIMTGSEAAIDNVNTKLQVAVSEINNETKAKLTEANGFWNKFLNTIKSGGNVAALASIDLQDRLDIIAESSGKLAAEERKAQIELNKIDNAAKKERKAQDEKDEADKQRAREEAAKARIQLEKDLQAALLDLAKKSQQAQLSLLTGSDLVKAEFEQGRRAINELEKQLIAKGKLTNDNFKLSEEQQQQFNNLRAANEQAAQNKLDDIVLKGIIDRQKAEADVNSDAIEQANKWVDEEFQILQDANTAKILLTEEGTQARIDAEILAIETERDFTLKNTQLTLDQQTIIIQNAKNKIAALTKGKGDVDIFKLLGIDVSDEDKEKIVAAFQTTLNAVQKAIEDQFDEEQEIIDKKKKANEDLLESYSSNIEDLNSKLAEEQELQKQGLASNVDAIKEQIAQATAARNEELEHKRQIAKEEEALARKKAQLDAVQKAAALALAGAELVSAGAKIIGKGATGGPVGIAIAIAQLAVVIAAFASFASSAKKATGFWKGGYTGDGGKFDEAGTVHKGEFVSKSETTAKHRKLLEAMHTEDYSKLKPVDLEPFLAAKGISLIPDGSGVPRFKQSSFTNILNTNKEVARLSSKDQSLKKLESIDKRLKQFYDHSKAKPEQEIMPDGSVKIKRGGTTTIIKKR